jgi:hypothetical protein
MIVCFELAVSGGKQKLIPEDCGTVQQEAICSKGVVFFTFGMIVCIRLDAFARLSCRCRWWLSST